MHLHFRRAATFLIALLSVGWVQAEIIYVSVNGSGDGTKDSTPTNLTNAVSLANDGDLIQMAAGNYLLTEQLIINKAITLEGATEGTSTIMASSDAWNDSGNSSQQDLISIVGGTNEGSVTLRYLTITKSMGSGILVQSPMTTTLEAVILKDNLKGAGLIIHSKVIARSITTSGNAWGGVNVDKEEPSLEVSFAFDENSLFHEAYDICSNDPSETSINYVTVPNNGKWNHGVYKTLVANEPIGGKFPYKNKRVWYDGLIVEVSDDDEGIFIYANGNKVNVTSEDVSTTTFSIGSDTDNSSIDLPVEWNLTLFGGAKNRSVATSNIYVTNNATLQNIYGGGYGELATKTQADVEGETRISLFPGNVTNMLVAGGKYYARSGQVKIFVENKSTANRIIAGGYDGGKTTNTIETSYEESVNRVANTTMNIVSSNVNYVYAGGGEGYSYTKQTLVQFNKATITGGLWGNGSDGRSDIVKVVAQNTTFERPDGEAPLEIAAVSGGRAGNVNLYFTGCDFLGTSDDYHVYAGATYNWSLDGSQSSNVHEITNRVDWSFDNCENLPFSLGLSDGLLGDVYVYGIPVQVEPFTYNQSGSGITTQFIVLQGKTWLFAKGVGFKNGETIATIANQGTLNISVSDMFELKAAIEANATRVMLPEGTITLDEQLVINKPIIIDGRADNNDIPLTILTANPNAPWPKNPDGSIQSATANLISIEGSALGNVNLNKLKITGSMASGINAESTMETMLSDIILTGNANAGLIMQSNVFAYQTTISGNGWGGVFIDNGNTGNIPRLNLDQSTIEEEGRPQVWSEMVDTNPGKLFERYGWHVFKTKNADKTKDIWLWTDDELTALVLPSMCGTGDDESEVSVFANGNPVTVYEEDNKLVIETANESMTITDKTSAGYYPVSLYGGSYMNAVSSTSITLNSGYIRNVYGGGRSDDPTMSANVRGDAQIKVNGGASADLFIGGGRYYAKTLKVDIAFGDETTAYTGKTGAVYVGGVDQGLTSNKDNPYKEWVFQNVNGVNIVNLTINGGTFGEVACGGGDGYTHTGISTVEVKDATIDNLFGAGSDGAADDVTVGLSNTKVVKNLSAVNRSHIGKLVMLIEKDCTFGENITTSLGASPKWANSDTNGAFIPCVTKSAQFLFFGNNGPMMQVGQGLDLANVTLTGAPALITTFHAGTPTNPVEGFQPTITKFTIDNSGGQWTFNSGLTITKEVEMAGYGLLTVDNSVCQVATITQLDYVLNNMVSQIQLAEGSYDGFKVNTSGVSIDGNKSTINGTITLGNYAYAVTLNNFKFNPGEGQKAIVNTNGSEMSITHNYWGSIEPNFEELVQTTGEIAPYPFYELAAMTEEDLAYQYINVEELNQTLPKIYPNATLVIGEKGSAILTQAGAKFETVTIEEGGQLIPRYGETTGAPATTERLAFIPNLANKWRAVGTPFEATLMLDEETEAFLSDQKADQGIWFAGLVDYKPLIEVKTDYASAGLWAANNGTEYALVSKEPVSLTVADEPKSTVEGLEMVVNPNTYDITLTQNVYVLSEDGTAFTLTTTPPTIKAFQSYVIADDNTKATLRSIGTADPAATANEFLVKEGYYLTTERGAILVHTAEPMELYVVAVSGAVVYHGTVKDGERIAVPTGIYAVNGQLVRVK